MQKLDFIHQFLTFKRKLFGLFGRKICKNCRNCIRYVQRNVLRINSSSRNIRSYLDFWTLSEVFPDFSRKVIGRFFKKPNFVCPTDELEGNNSFLKISFSSSFRTQIGVFSSFCLKFFGSVFMTTFYVPKEQFEKN